MLVPSALAAPPSLVTKAAAEFSEISHHITVKLSYGQIHRDLYVMLQNITHIAVGII